MTDTSTNTTQNDQQTPPALVQDTPAPSPAQNQQVGNEGTLEFWKAEAEKWKSLSRKHETNWEKATKELRRYEQANMTDAERAIAEAREAARQEVLASVVPQRVQDKLEAAAAKAGVDLSPLLPRLDVGAFVENGDVNQAAIAEFINQVAEQFGGSRKEPRFAQNLGIGPQGNGSNPAQLTRADLSRMTPREIAQARKEGRLDALMRGQV